MQHATDSDETVVPGRQIGPSDAQLEDVCKALIDSLVEDLGAAETRTAAAQEVARKLLKDNHYELAPGKLAELVPLTRGLPHRETSPIPPVRSG